MAQNIELKRKNPYDFHVIECRLSFLRFGLLFIQYILIMFGLIWIKVPTKFQRNTAQFTKNATYSEYYFQYFK